VHSRFIFQGGRLEKSGQGYPIKRGPNPPAQRVTGYNKRDTTQMGSLIFRGEKGANAEDGSSFPASS